MQVQLIEHFFAIEDEDLDKVLWEREKYCQAELYTITHE